MSAWYSSCLTYMAERAQSSTIINFRLNSSSPFDQKFVAAESHFCKCYLSVQLMLRRKYMAQCHDFPSTSYIICIYYSVVSAHDTIEHKCLHMYLSSINLINLDSLFTS